MASSDRYAKCWANSLGDCAGPMSLEHIFSNATSRKGSGERFAVKGMANMPDQLIGLDGPKARILCQSHNSRLSPLDSEAKKLADGLHRLVDGEEHTTVHLDGTLLERWALKTLTNFLVSGLAHTKKFVPPKDLVLTVFGLKRMPRGLGLHLLRLENYRPLSSEQSGVTPVWGGSSDGTPRECVGGIIYLHGAAFLVLLDTRFLEALRRGEVSFGNSGFSPTYDGLKYHPSNAQFDDGRGHNLAVLFDWTQNDGLSIE